LRAIQRAPGYTNERNAIEIAEAIAAPAFGGAIRTPSHQTTGKWNSRAFMERPLLADIVAKVFFR
jgi:hypothetical protein